ncbi:UNVERIFIED_CONTAM: hypothetical protein H355_003865, partial [Colinus virginianus]
EEEEEEEEERSLQETGNAQWLLIPHQYGPTGGTGIWGSAQWWRSYLHPTPVTVRVKLEEVTPGNAEDPEMLLDPPSPPPEPTGDEWWESNGRLDPEEEEEEEEERSLQETGAWRLQNSILQSQRSFSTDEGEGERMVTLVAPKSALLVPEMDEHLMDDVCCEFFGLTSPTRTPHPLQLSTSS